MHALRHGLVLVAATLLAACTNAGPAQIPISGVSGNSGGAELAIYYDKDGHSHFRG